LGQNPRATRLGFIAISLQHFSGCIGVTRSSPTAQGQGAEMFRGSYRIDVGKALLS
jgi:hypothetical protein